jgi:multidrug transporter EmrE-like cation transporter
MPNASITTSPWAVLCFLAAAFLGALGQYLYKAGAESAVGGVTSYLFNLRLWGGIVCYVAVMVLFVAAFKFGGALSVLYPVYASTFIWSALIARFALHEPIRFVNVAGMFVLVVGMWLMGLQR